jgi:fermentation-respiration switch protein FrsA (DUF1100 family)
VKTDVKFDSAGLTLAGHLYTPDSAAAGPRSAIVVSHPASGVKEQTAGLYASRLAQHGFITLTFDAAYQGESAGEPPSATFVIGRDQTRSYMARRVSSCSGICAWEEWSSYTGRFR